MSKGREFQLEHPSHSMAHRHGDLYITSGTALYLYDLNGTQIKKLYEDTCSKGSTVAKCAASPNGNMIYVINQPCHQLLTLARDGTVLSYFTDPQLKYPSVCVSPAGQVLVCDYASEIVMQVDREGKRQIAIVTKISRPTAVFYSRDDLVMLTSQSSIVLYVYNSEVNQSLNKHRT
ncbi:uncharacterized protein LOC127848278 [Dreissena polymorpha]|uniref:uncharacterized protein LOC127848278 n=1 Tax=Dreissena polymorpha TaxID=45954 RepID=UPI0022653BD0|nr:uncharacterized protein LOC127848278 [Dreissena polymorpha]